MQRCSGVYDINVIWKDFMETLAEVADHIVGRRPKSKPSSGSWWTKDFTHLHSLEKSVRKAGHKFASTEIKSQHNQLQGTFKQRKRLAKEILSEKHERKFEQSIKTGGMPSTNLTRNICIRSWEVWYVKGRVPTMIRRKPT